MAWKHKPKKHSEKADELTRRRFLQTSTVALAGATLLPQRSLAESQTDASLPTGVKLNWDATNVEAVNAKRSRASLDGIWRFTPAVAQQAEAPKAGWGYIKVPGSWGNHARHAQAAPPDLLSLGSGRQWIQYDGERVASGWYERQALIPVEWQGRVITLRFDRICTDAIVYVNGTLCGRVSWPWGSVEITRAVTPGKSALISVLVAAIADSQMVGHFWQNAFMAVTYSAASLATRGLTGSVYLESRSSAAHISDVFIRTSTRKNNIALDVDLSGLERADRVQFVADMLNDQNEVEKSFTQSVAVTAKSTQTVTVSWPWANPRLWDVDQPNLYTLRLSATGAGIDDQYDQKFGFREFWIQGRQFYLNGTQIHLRQPCFHHGPIGDVGDNFSEIGSWYPDTRGDDTNLDPELDQADGKGYLAAVWALDANKYMRDPSGNLIWEQNKQRALERTAVWMQHYRNHPSIVMWVAGANFFNNAVDLDPRHLGRHGWSATDSAWQQLLTYAREMFAEIRKLDDTRVYYSHEGADTGDVHSGNCYLDLLPLQEREEWLSEWAKSGEMPITMTEFGTPVDCTFRRGHDGFGTNITSEPLLTEYAAIYFGNDAYRWEGPEYRQFLHNIFRGGILYESTQDKFDSFTNMHKIQALFRKGTWRSWRSAGSPGGLRTWSWMQDELKEINFPTLAWIAGPPEADTAKDHHFRSGQKFQKQVILINDTRQPQPFTARWTATIEEATVGTGELRGELEISEIRKIPFEVNLPSVRAGSKAEGQITLTATIGEAVHHDDFSFRVFAAESATGGQLAIVDPDGLTQKMLASLGYTPHAWNGEPAPLLVIGRNGLRNNPTLNAKLESFVGAGGRALIFAQDPAWMTKALGWRVCPKVSRRVFPIANFEATAGLDADDLCDWTGSSTLIEAYPQYEGNYQRGNEGGQPYAGWHWGNRGGVASAAVEKPHLGGWTPLLECEFDLAYAPWMKLDYGRGRLMLCTLDVEDHVELDPAARLTAEHILDYALHAPLAHRANKVIYLGGDLGAAWLEKTGVAFQRADTLDADTELLLVGPDAAVDAVVLDTYLQKGGKAFFLPRTQAEGWLGARLVSAAMHFAGSLSVPDWPETLGLSASDLRWRTYVDDPAWILTGGAELGADGLLGRKTVGRGVAVFCQVNPDWFHADEKTYFHYARWRSTRAVAQLLANLGARFPVDSRIFHPLDTWSLDLDGQWEMKPTLKLPPAASEATAHSDPGITPEARALVEEVASSASWTSVTLPQMVPFFNDFNGEAVFRKEMDVPPEEAGKNMILALGTLADFDSTFFNGVEIGHTDIHTENWRQASRNYLVPAHLVKAGRNVIVVRLFSCFGPGGFAGKPGLPVGPDGDRSGHDSKGPRIGLEMSLSPAPDAVQKLNWYCTDYRTDFPMGDNPYRYYRW
jgi:beta-galactosidase